jgi:fructosamine-3-kinase
MLAGADLARGRRPLLRMPRADSFAPSPADSLADWLAADGRPALRRRSPVGGGCIHQAWCLELQDGHRLFAKTNRAEALPLLQAECDGLAALGAAAGLADSGAPLVPQPIALLELPDQVVLLLPWLELQGGGCWEALGAALAGLHRRSLERVCGTGDRGGAHFGWGRDNFIGAGPQANGWLDDWGLFFAQRRLQPQLERLAAAGIRLRGANELLAAVPLWLADHRPQACLVHGDLWTGNAGLTASGQGVLFDPAVHRADREVDLAMARLFGGFPVAFHRGYEASWPLPAGHRQRVDLYNLYHLLNHANLFAGGYVQGAQACLERLLKSPPL